jgi:hypothetical protein
MNHKNIFLAAAILNFVIAEAIIFGFFSTHGLNLGLFGAQAFLTHGGALAWADVLGSSFVFWGIAALEDRKHNIGKLWLYVLLNLCVGLCVALPLFWWARERRIEAARQ